MSSKKWCVLDDLRQMADARQRLNSSNVLLEQLAEASRQARELRDEAIVEMSAAGTGVHEIINVSGMSRSHVRATISRAEEP